jgi:hypothetical protein
MWDMDGFTKYSKGGLTQGPTNLNLVHTHVKFGTTPWMVRSSRCIVYATSRMKYQVTF